MSIAFSVTAEVPSTATTLGVPVFDELELPEAVPIELDRDYCAQRDFSGRPGEVMVVPGENGATVVAIGMGERDSVSAETFRRAGSALVRAAPKAPPAALWLRAPPPPPREAAPAAQAIVEGAVLAAYQFVTYKGDQRPQSLAEVALLSSPGQESLAVESGVRRGTAVARAVSLARDLVNEPAGSMTPSRLAQVAMEVAEEAGLSATVMDEVAIHNAGLGGLAGVAQGSEEPPRLIELTYQPTPEAVARARGRRARVPTVALVGKGITFDSGGLSLKTAEGMMTMKTDMSGAAAVLATMSVLSALEVPTRVLGFMPVTENMPGGRAIKPGDVLKIRNGKTIEVLNTDAEGRLVLADGLSLAVEAGPDAVVDLATLTGACVVALGRQLAGLMGNHEGLVAQVQEAAGKSGEAVWPLPLPEEYRRLIDSDVADMKNIGSQNQAGALVAGLILREFVDGVPWAHLDIAGPARSDADEGYTRKGASGFGVRTLLELLSSFEVPGDVVMKGTPGDEPTPRPTRPGRPRGAGPTAAAGARSSRGPHQRRSS